MDFSFSDLDFYSVETSPGSESRAAFTVSSETVFRKNIDIVPSIVDYKAHLFFETAAGINCKLTLCR